MSIVEITMCGRYTLYDFQGLTDRFDIDQVDADLLNSIEENYNVAPSQINPVVIQNSPNHLELMEWGYTPFPPKSGDKPFKIINAKAETIDEKPMFKKAFLERRCLVPANGFYEWKATKAGKVPYFIHLKDQELFAFAGIYTSWQDEKGKEVRTYAIITTEPNELMADIHNRMPVILPKENEVAWLDKELKDKHALMAMLEPYDTKKMDAYIVKKDVNSPRNNNKDLINKAT